MPDDASVRTIVSDLSALRARAAASDVAARSTPAEAAKTAKRLVDECPATARPATAEACLQALAEAAKKPSSSAHAAAALKRLSHIRHFAAEWGLAMPPGVSAHVREATSSSVVAFTLTASSVTESARLLTQALNAVQALEPDDADRAFVAACALERVAMRCLALRLDRVDKIARPSIQRGTSAFERAAMHAQASVRPPTQAELVASAFVRDSAALDTAARGALEDDERDGTPCTLMMSVLDCAAARRRVCRRLPAGRRGCSS